jgi:hypothetical protein
MIIGGSLFTIRATTVAFLEEHFDSVDAGVDLSNRAIYYAADSTEAQLNNNLCHELAHALEYQVMINQEEGFNEMEIQSLGNALHQIIRALVEANSDLTVE